MNKTQKLYDDEADNAAAELKKLIDNRKNIIPYDFQYWCDVYAAHERLRNKAVSAFLKRQGIDITPDEIMNISLQKD